MRILKLQDTHAELDRYCSSCVGVLYRKAAGSITQPTCCCKSEQPCERNNADVLCCDSGSYCMQQNCTKACRYPIAPPATTRCSCRDGPTPTMVGGQCHTQTHTHRAQRYIRGLHYTPRTQSNWPYARTEQSRKQTKQGITKRPHRPPPEFMLSAASSGHLQTAWHAVLADWARAHAASSGILQGMLSCRCCPKPHTRDAWCVVTNGGPSCATQHFGAWPSW